MPPKSPWVWDDVSRRYHSTETGQYIGVKKMLGMRDAYLDAKKSEMSDLTDRLIDNEINTAQWTQEMRRQIRTVYRDQYCLSHGGRQNMTQADWGRLGQMVRGQYEHLSHFEADIKAGRLSPARITQRANMYIESGTQAYERGRAQSFGISYGQLPAYPGDGSTLCKANCRCHWDIEETDGAWLATWTLGEAEHCETCVERSTTWAPYRVMKPIQVGMPL